MNNNIFSFADTYWHQLSGTAMGTPTACAYATITYGHFENSQFCQDSTTIHCTIKRYIDDIFGIWIPSTDNNSDSWLQFKTLLNTWGNLKWKIKEPSSYTVFLDLNIHLHNSKITTSTYMNLYLYIPPLSVHPPSCLKGLIAGEMRHYWLQNDPASYKAILLKFIERLLDRWHTLPSLLPILAQAAQTLDSRTTLVNGMCNNNSNTLYIHKTYHPSGLQWHNIRQLYEQILKPHIPFKQLTVMISRPMNLRDVLTKAKLQPPTTINIQQLIDDINKNASQTQIQNKNHQARHSQLQIRARQPPCPRIFLSNYFSLPRQISQKAY